AINVRLHSLKRTLVQGSSEHEDVTVIDGEIQRLDCIVRDVLHFARPAEPRPVTRTAGSLFSRVQGLLGSQLEKASIRLNLASSPTLWIRVDPQQIEQVLINLIQNAAESIARDGTITLRARSTLMPLAGHATPVVILEVIDTGKGIPLKVQERLFDPFFTTKEAGTGLGLSIAVRPLALSCRAWRKMKMKSRPKILLVEDDASIVGGLKKELQAEGYEVA